MKILQTETPRLGQDQTVRPILQIFLGLLLVFCLSSNLAFAQADPDVIEDEFPEPVAKQADVQKAAAPVVSEEKKTSPEKATTGNTNYLSWAWKSLGPSYSLIFFSLSFTLVMLFVKNLLAAKRENILPSELIEGFEQLLNEKKFQEAYEFSKTDNSFLGHVLSAGLAKVSSAGYPEAIEAMQEVGEEENMELEHRLSYMALIGSISPMFGLFGTVHGMIEAFNIIASSDSQPAARELAEGISTALFTTLIGLAIAIPAIAAYNILRNRVARLVLEVGIVSEGLMSRFQKVGH